MHPYPPQRSAQESLQPDALDGHDEAYEPREHEDPDLAFIDGDDARGEAGSGGGLANEDDGIPGSEPGDLDLVDPDGPAGGEPLVPRPTHHEPRSPGPLPGAPFPRPGSVPDDLPASGSGVQRGQRTPGGI